MKITSNEYISKLRDLRAYTKWISRNIGSAADNIRYCHEDLSKLDVQNCREIAEILLVKLRAIENCTIEN